MSPLIATIFLHGLCLANAINFTPVYELNTFDSVWQYGGIRQIIKPNDVDFRYMAVFRKRLFLSLENTYSGIPASLVWLPTSGTSTAPPKLAPFPSWQLHLRSLKMSFPSHLWCHVLDEPKANGNLVTKENCNSIQMARGTEPDTDGRLWVLDQGSKNCSGKIWIFNLLKNDTTERVHQFPDTVVSHPFDNRHLRDIVLDKTPDDYLAYITDPSSEHIVVYSRKMDKSWSVRTPGRKWVSLALSPNREARQLYLEKYRSDELYSVAVSELKNEDGSAAVQLIGKWNGQPYRMLINSANVLYAAFYNQNYLSKWNISEPFHEKRFREVGRLDFGWPFTFALDTSGSLWLTERNVTGGKSRFKLLKASVGARISRSMTVLTTIQVVKSTQTPIRKTGTPRPDLESNETSGGFTDLGESQSLNTILIWLLVCFFVSCLVLSGTVISWLTLRIRRMQTSFRQVSMDNHAIISVFPEDPAYDDVGPENSNTEVARPENPDESLYAEVGPDLHYDYVIARTPSPEPYEVPLHLGNNDAGIPSEREYDEVGSNIYDDVGPGPSSAPSGNGNSGRNPTDLVQYLEVLP